MQATKGQSWKTRVLRTVTAMLGIGLVVAGLRSSPLMAENEDTEEARRVEAATQVLREILRAEDADVPKALLARAKAIAVVPHVVRGAFIVGGRWGKGVVTVRDTDAQWGPASFLDLSGASVGFQIGGDATDLMMIFIEEDGLDALLEDRVELGGNVSVAAGPIGRSGQVGTNLTLDAAIYAYSRSKGAFAGAALDGTVITIDDSANEVAFGEPVDGDAALDGSLKTPDIFAPFVDAVVARTPAVAE